jgi:MEMO1 family protein
MVDYPKIRNGLEALPFEHEGQRLILLRDRLGFARDSLLISPHLATLLVHMDGQNSLRDLQSNYMRMTGNLLYLEDLQNYVKRLDDGLFLESERFLELVTRERNAFLQNPVRPMQFGGVSYPAEPQRLRTQLDDFLSRTDGATKPDRPQGRRLVGLMAPHIDLNAGGVCFAHAYRAAMEADAPSTWVILGTGHEPAENYFALTQKDYETPLGLVPHDREYCRELLQRAPRDLLAGQYGHRKEHTIEFQTVFLAHTQPSFRIVPLLCSFSLDDWEADGAYIDEVAGLLRELARERYPTVGFIASVDLAHIGPRYGDSFRPHEGTVAEHLEADRQLMESLCRCDPAEFMREAGRGRNRRRICGLAPLYVLSKIFAGAATGVVLDHSHVVVDHHNSFVTFASMAFYEM